MKRFIFAIGFFLFFGLLVLPLVNKASAVCFLNPDGFPCVTNPIHSMCCSGYCRAFILKNGETIPVPIPGVCKPVAKCTCDSANPKLAHCQLGNKAVDFTCHKDDVCVNDPEHIFSAENFLDGAGLKGIGCTSSSNAIANPKKLPEPPEPPCKDLRNGQCYTTSTTLGDIPTSPEKFITRLFSVLLGAAGSIALLLLMRSGYRIMTARGNPEGIQEGREQFVAAILGLIFLIFSFVIFQVITNDLLKLPNSTGVADPAGDVGSPTCGAAGGGCMASKICQADGGKVLGALGCTGGTICCK